MFELVKETNRKDVDRIRRADVCLIAFFLILALGSMVWSVFFRKDGQTLRISCDGQAVADVSLSQLRVQDRAGENSGTVRYCLLLYSGEDVSCQWYEAGADFSPLLSEGNGYNLLAVSGERVWMEAADCRDQICVHHIPITGGGESIICLPHKLAVEIIGKADGETPDGVAKTERSEKPAWNEGRRGHEKNG